MASDAVVFLPGITGTTLVETNRARWDTIWSGVQMNFESIEDLELTAAHTGAYYDAALETLIRPGQIEAAAYADFLRGLRSAGTRPVYIFGYDWRLPSRVNAERFGSYLSMLSAKSEALRGRGFKTIDVVAHSLGAFVVMAWLAQDTAARMKKLGRIVLVAPPFAGSIDTVEAALIGRGWFAGVLDKVRKLVRVTPGALELLPTYEQASLREDGSPHDFFAFADWQSNVRRRGAAATKMRRALADAADGIRNGLLDPAALRPAQRKRFLVVAKGGYDTYQSLHVLDRSDDGTRNFVDFDGACRSMDGDGRVAHVSSCRHASRLATVLVERNPRELERGLDHAFMLRDGRVQKLIRAFLFKDGELDTRIPGGSVRRVYQLRRRRHARSGLYSWSAD